MERSTTYGCHFIDHPLSSFILRIDPSELPTHARWWIQQTLSVGGRDFLAKLWGYFKFSSFTELVQRLVGCCSVLLTSLKDVLDVLMWKDSLCHYHARYVNMECLQGSHSVPNLSFLLACITAFCFPNFLGVRVRQ